MRKPRKEAALQPPVGVTRFCTQKWVTTKVRTHLYFAVLHLARNINLSIRIITQMYSQRDNSL